MIKQSVHKSEINTLLYPKYLGPENLGFHSLQISKYLHVHYELCWKQNPNLKKKFVSYTCYTHSLKVILYNIFSATTF